jgi:hypothetical protein
MISVTVATKVGKFCQLQFDLWFLVIIAALMDMTNE